MVSTLAVDVIHGLLLIYRPQRDGSWLTDSKQFTHKVVTCQPQTGRRAGKVRQPKTDVLNTEPRHKPKLIIRKIILLTILF